MDSRKGDLEIYMGLCAFVRFCRMWISDGGDLYGILNRRVYAHGWELKSTLPDGTWGVGAPYLKGVPVRLLVPS